MNYIYGSIYILGKKLYNYMSFQTISSTITSNTIVVKRMNDSLPWYLKYKYFFSNSKEIIPRLFLGSSFSAFNKFDLDQKNINVVLNITDEIDNFYEGKSNITYYKFPIRDNNQDDISMILEETYNIIEYHLELGDRILVHCFMGASRSASIVINYIMKKYNTTYINAFNLVKRTNPIINLTEKFYNTLNNMD